MSEQELKLAIWELVKGNPTGWTIGLSYVPAERKKQHEGDGNDTRRFISWRADSLDVARRVEAYFTIEIERKLNGGIGGDIPEDKDVFVYVF